MYFKENEGEREDQVIFVNIYCHLKNDLDQLI